MTFQHNCFLSSQNDLIIGSTTIALCLHINNLIPDLKERLDHKPESIRTQVKPVKLSSQFLSKYFKTEQIAGEIEKIICAALNMYFLSSDKKP